MPAGHLAISLAAETAADTAAPWIRAAVAVAIALALVYVVKRAFDRRARHIAERMMGGGLTPEVDTRLRYVQRLIGATIMAIGIAIALSQFTRVDDLADKLLASGAIVAAIVGFAARQTLANVVAGIMLAITQPVRVGDYIDFEDRYGQVEDVTLSYTVLRTAADQRVVIPNEKLASGILRNDTLQTPLVGLDVNVWVAPDADLERAIAVLAQESGQSVTVAEAVPWGVRLAVGSDPALPADRYGREADLRARCLHRLRAEGLLPKQGFGGAEAN